MSGNHPDAVDADQGQTEAVATRPLPRSRWLLSDAHRSSLSAVLGTALLLPLIWWLIASGRAVREDFDVTVWMWLWVLVSWATLTLGHVLLTWAAFRGLGGDDLTRAVAVGDIRRKSRWRRLWTGGEAASYAAQMAGFAMIGVAVLLVDGRLRNQPVILTAAGALVVLAWLECLLSYALHYARQDVAEPFLQFPEGDDVQRSWSDYLYLATSVQTTFGVTDLVVGTRRGRRIVMGHALLAFGFNTVLIAVMVSLALGG